MELYNKNKRKADKLLALAADMEDVLLRFEGSSDDTDTIQEVIDDLLDMAAKLQTGR